ncbi:MAG: GNAT family N-acetyltransferase [Lunatimonas sp.]|uniref:GNAT family N-acetyltransferase n=1 Tax=Lunatimonas sp. TaxID=2060141 RepID=UPI00263B39C8|nr:GNAT family N-acetyltransferase [Lunatimonas sp.]MCC5939079.1 GNAT family N-acetyltransferase [Lunatimonas sp.]
MAIEVSKVNNTDELEVLFRIREEVFVVEQQVAPEEEYDEYEERSTHFLAKYDGQPVATARWRFTEKGVKLERFAVLKPYRGKGVGKALVGAVLADIDQNPAAASKVRYLHAQVTALGLYEKFGFEKVGDLFEECKILHYKMQLEPPVAG